MSETRRTVWAAITIQPWAWESAGWSPFPVTVKAPEGSCGYLPVYETREKALAEHPDAMLLPLTVTESE